MNFTFLDKSAEEKTVTAEVTSVKTHGVKTDQPGVEEGTVMDKTISTSSDESEPTIKVDNLDKNNELEKDAIEARKSERDVTQTLPLPLFRFEEKQRVTVEEMSKKVLNAAEGVLGKDISEEYTPLIGYIRVPKVSEIKYLIDLTVSRNKELYNASPKEMVVELVKCYFDKKLRVKMDIPEDKLINQSEYPDYFKKIKEIREAFGKLKDYIISTIDKKDTGDEKDIEIYMDNSEGDDDYGAGVSIFLKYNKPIDYSNEKRGKEDYSDIFCALDKDFQSQLNEQNSINLAKSVEAIADGMAENGSDDEENEAGDSNDADSGNGFDDEEEDLGGDDTGDDMEGGDGEDDMMGEGDESSDNSGDSKPKADKNTPGVNPFADINAKDRITNEFNELKTQIDKVLCKLEGFKSTSLVNKLAELSGFVNDALKNAYTVPVEDSLIRYNLYVTQFEDLVSKLKKFFESHSKNEKK